VTDIPGTRKPTRSDVLLRGLDHNSNIVEIGPWHAGVAPKRDGWNTTIVDFTDAASLRESAQSHPDLSMQSRAQDIEDVDVIWHGSRSQMIV